MAAEIFRRRVDDDVGAEFERPLQGRRSKSIVDDHQRIDLVGAAHDLGDVDDAKIGIGRRLEIDDAGLFAELRRQCLGVHEIGNAHDDAETRKRLSEIGESIAVKRMVDDHFVAGAEQGHHHARHRRHAGGGGHPGLAAFEARHPLFEDGLRRIAGSAVNVAGALAPEHFRPGLRGFEGEGRGHVNRRRERALFARRIISKMDRARRKALRPVASQGLLISRPS